MNNRTMVFAFIIVALIALTFTGLLGPTINLFIGLIGGFVGLVVGLIGGIIGLVMSFVGALVGLGMGLFGVILGFLPFLILVGVLYWVVRRINSSEK